MNLHLLNGFRENPLRDDVAYPIFNRAGGGGGIQGTLDELITAASGPYAGLKVATITVVVAPRGKSSLIGEQVDVVDHSPCVFDLSEEELLGVWVWASEGIAKRIDEPTEDTEPHWCADDRCCVAADV